MEEVTVVEAEVLEDEENTKELSKYELQNELDALDNEQVVQKIERPVLRDKEELFCHEYMVDLNATQAALRAGYNPTTRMSSYALGKQLKKLLRWRIDELMAERKQKTDIKAEWVVRELVETVEKCREYHPVLDFKGKQVTIDNDDGTMSAVYEFNAKGATTALELLGKHLGMFKEKVEISFDDSYAQIMKEARERAVMANATQVITSKETDT